MSRAGGLSRNSDSMADRRGQGKLHFPYAALRQLPLCELAGSEHLATQAVHFPQV
nr:hypothetical protein [Bacteroides intestinalis]